MRESRRGPNPFRAAWHAPAAGAVWRPRFRAVPLPAFPRGRRRSVPRQEPRCCPGCQIRLSWSGSHTRQRFTNSYFKSWARSTENWFSVIRVFTLLWWGKSNNPYHVHLLISLYMKYIRVCVHTWSFPSRKPSNWDYSYICLCRTIA